MTEGHVNIAGCWTLKSCYLETVETKERLFPYGENPRGALIMHESGRMAAVITPRASKAPATDEDRAKAFGLLIAYSGRYRLEGSRFITDVDVSWLPQWLDTSQGRSFVVHDDCLDIVSDPAPSPLRGGALVIGVLTWAREA
jgi:hypothetical protein